MSDANHKTGQSGAGPPHSKTGEAAFVSVVTHIECNDAGIYRAAGYRVDLLEHLNG